MYILEIGIYLIGFRSSSFIVVSISYRHRYHRHLSIILLSFSKKTKKTFSFLLSYLNFALEASLRNKIIYHSI